MKDGNGSFTEATAKDYDLPLDVVIAEFAWATCYEEFYQGLESILLDNILDTL